MNEPVASFNSRDQLATDTYDANGNTVTGLLNPGSSAPVSDVYDFEDRLILRYRPDGSLVNLSYDADGIRRQKAVFDSSSNLLSSTGWLIDTNNLTGNPTGSGNMSGKSG